MIAEENAAMRRVRQAICEKFHKRGLGICACTGREGVGRSELRMNMNSAQFISTVLALLSPVIAHIAADATIFIIIARSGVL